MHARHSAPRKIKQKSQDHTAGEVRTIGNFAPSFKPRPQADQALELGDQPAALPWSFDESQRDLKFDDPRAYTFSSQTYDDGNAHRGFLEALYDRLNGYVRFDSLLAQYNHNGVVYFEIEVDRQGKLIVGSIRSQAKDRVLKVYAIRTILLPALATPLDSNLWIKNEERIKLKIQIAFFRSKSEDSLFDENPQRISGHALSFRRFTAEDPVAKNLKQQLVSGGIGYDLFAVYESWKKYNRAQALRKIQVDPFDLYRADPYY